MAGKLIAFLMIATCVASLCAEQIYIRPVFHARATGGGVSPYWTDSEYSSSLYYLDGYTNALGFMDSSPLALVCTSSAPAVIEYTNQYARLQRTAYFDGVDDLIAVVAGTNSATGPTFTTGTNDLPFHILGWYKTLWSGVTASRILVKANPSGGRYEYAVWLNAFGVKVDLLGQGDQTKPLSITQAGNVGMSNTWQAFAYSYDGSSTTNGLLLWTNGVPVPAATRSKNAAYTNMTQHSVLLRVGQVFSGLQLFKGEIGTVEIGPGTIDSTYVSNWVEKTCPTNNLVNKSWIPTGQ